MEDPQEIKDSISKKDAVMVSIAVFVIVIASYLLLNTFKTPAKETAEELNPKPAESVIAEEKQPETVVNAPVEMKTFNVSAGNFSFSLPEIRVKAGDKVKIIFKNDEGFHDWVLDEFSARTGRLQAGGTETIEFTADKAGTFEYYCSVGSHRAMGMKGNLFVEE